MIMYKWSCHDGDDKIDVGGDDDVSMTMMDDVVSPSHLNINAEL